MNGDTVLRLFWWLVLGAWMATIGVALVRELGFTVLLPYLGRTDEERRTLIARQGNGEGHPVWLLLGGALVGAWWPLFDATLFSGLWLVLLFIAVALLAGPVGRGYRDAVSTSLRGAWDGAWMLIALAALLVFGLAAGVTVSGVPLHLDQHAQAVWGSFATRFTPYDVLVPGLMTIAFGIWLGAAGVASNGSGPASTRARQLLLPAGGLVLLIFAGGAAWATQLPGYAVGGIPNVGASPLHGTTFAVGGAYLERFFAHLSLLVIPVLTALAILGGLFYAWRGKIERVGAFAAAAVVGMVATLGAMTFPVILPSFSMPSQSLTLWNAAAERPVLIALLAWLAVLVPAAVGYQMWLRRRGRSGSVQAGETAR